MYKLVKEIKSKTFDSFKIKINQKLRRSYKIYDNLTLTVTHIWMMRKIRKYLVIHLRMTVLLD